MKFQWNKNGIPLEIQLEFNRNFNGIPVGSIVNPVEISIIYQWEFQWNANRNKFEIQLKFQWYNSWGFNEMPIEINLKISRNFNEIPMEIHCKSS